MRDRDPEGKMRDLAPDITRQRLLIEGCYTSVVNRDAVQRYLFKLAAHLDLRSYDEPRDPLSAASATENAASMPSSRDRLGKSRCMSSPSTASELAVRRCYVRIPEPVVSTEKHDGERTAQPHHRLV
jgi:hypothetical protein